MIKVAILGAGNVGSHLIRVFKKTPTIEIVQVYNRSLSKIEMYRSDYKITDDVNTLVDADVYIITISDDEIHSFSASLPLQNKLVVHTSGTKDINELSGEFNKGVFYPLQTITKGKEIDFETIPICIEANNIADEKILFDLANLISSSVHRVNSLQRRKLHLAGVFVNNFTNHLFQIGEDICKSNELPFEILYPLIQETATKILAIHPKEAQTGPAIRKNSKTIAEQEAQLSGTRKELYTLITKSIQESNQ